MQFVTASIACASCPHVRFLGDSLSWSSQRGHFAQQEVHRRHEHSVNDVHNPIGHVVVCGGDLCTVYEDGGTRDSGRHGFALHGLDHLHIVEVLGVHVAARHVIREDLDELCLVRWLKKVGEDARGERGERLVGRGKDGERALAR